MGKDRIPARKILADNIARLAPKHPDGRPNVTQLGGVANLNVGGAQRLLSGETSGGVDVIDRVAAKYALHAWELLYPGLDPDNRPGMPPEAREPAPKYDPRAEMSRDLLNLFWSMNEDHRDDILLLVNRWAVQDNPGPPSVRDPIKRRAKAKA